MEKNELIKSILQFNVSTNADFLGRFSEPELKAYLDRVSLVGPPLAGVRGTKLPAPRMNNPRRGKIRRLLDSARVYWGHVVTPRHLPS